MITTMTTKANERKAKNIERGAARLMSDPIFAAAVESASLEQALEWMEHPEKLIAHVAALKATK